MTSTVHPLLSAILANPTDDGVRLVYADWLEERGREEEAGKWRKCPKEKSQ